MALITCPECKKEISDKSEVCIHCGYPIAKEAEKLDQKKKQATLEEWRARNKAALELPTEESIPVFLELGDEGYLYGYYNAAVRCWLKLHNPQLAYEYYMKAYNIDAQSCGGSVARDLGNMHADKNSVLFDPEKAIQYLKSSQMTACKRLLGLKYDPGYKDDGFEKYKDAATALSYYEQVLLDKDYPSIASTYNDIGVIYGNFFDSPVKAACYCLLALRKESNQTRKNNYEYYIAEVRKKDPLWERNIEKIRNHEEIIPMINRVIAEIEKEIEKEIEEINRIKQQRPHCPTCGSTNISKVGTMERTVSTYMWGFFSKKIGKQFKCLKCGYFW